MQRSYQHLEKDLGRRKDREVELLALTEKLSSANAELQAARSSWESKVRVMLTAAEKQASVFTLCCLWSHQSTCHTHTCSSNSAWLVIPVYCMY